MSFTQAFYEHQGHLIDNRYQPIRGGRWTISISEPKKVAGCAFCQDPTLADRILDAAGARNDDL